MIDSILQKLLAADDPAEKAAIAAESVFEKVPEEIGVIARSCVILHWFDEALLEALLKDVPLVQGNSKRIYQHIVSLPFIESLAWGAAFNNLTREGLMKRYALSKPDLLVIAAKLAAPDYLARGEYGTFAAEAFFCYVVAGESRAAIELLDNLLEEAIRREDWSFIDSLVQLQDEAEQLPFAHS